MREGRTSTRTVATISGNEADERPHRLYRTVILHLAQVSMVEPDIRRHYFSMLVQMDGESPNYPLKHHYSDLNDAFIPPGTLAPSDLSKAL